jgi:hypothetical protein
VQDCLDTTHLQGLLNPNSRRRTVRKPIGITVPYREVGYKEDAMKMLEEKVKALEKRIEQLEKQRKEK